MISALQIPHLPGKYVIAVSGGVDSIVLLDVLTKNRNPELVVAHFDHGIRSDSADDELFVRQLASSLNLPYETERIQLGSYASEAEARDRRYVFLHRVAKKHSAQAIITAHHQDDIIETLFINLVRGTGRRGASSLQSTKSIYRPLLDVPKSEIYYYAKQHKLNWREDSTNTNQHYLRNNIRHKVVASMTTEQRRKALACIKQMHTINNSIEKELNALLHRGLHKGKLVLNRSWFSLLPHEVAQEVAYILLRDVGAKDIDKKMIDRTVVAIKTMRPGKMLQVAGVDILLTKRSARFKSHSKTDEKRV